MLGNNKEAELPQWIAVLEIYPGAFSLDLLSSISKYTIWIEAIICIHSKGRKKYVALKQPRMAMITSCFEMLNHELETHETTREF